MIQGDLVYGDKVTFRGKPAKVIHVEHDWHPKPPTIAWLEIRYETKTILIEGIEHKMKARIFSDEFSELVKP